jgi:hypothetical protein
MSQQEVNFEEIDHHGPHASYPGYQGTPQQPHYASSFSGEKLSGQGIGRKASPAQRLALAIVSLVLFMLVIFGLVLIAAIAHADIWAAIPILMIIFLFGAAVISINIVFNRDR